jgi:integrase
MATSQPPKPRKGRTSSFGNVRRLPSGRWQARYVGPDGRHYAAGTFPTKQDADGALARYRVAVHQGDWINPTAGRVSVVEFATRWLAQRTDLRPTTRAKYRHLLDRHILPALGARPLAGLSSPVVRGWYHELASRHQTSADDAYRLLRTIMNTAVADGIVARSPCQVKGAGQVRSPERPVASVPELAAAVEALPERLRLAALLAAWCQLRRGEVLARRRRDIDVSRATVTVTETLVMPFGEKPLLSSEPKTQAGRRTLTIPPNIMPSVQWHLERFVNPEPDAWLFGTATGTAVSPRNFNRAWTRARTAAGRPDLHLHDLRHSGLTWAAATGASTADLMRRGGHKHPRAALRYQHSTSDRDRSIALALGTLATKETPTQPETG